MPNPACPCGQPANRRNGCPERGRKAAKNRKRNARLAYFKAHPELATKRDMPKPKRRRVGESRQRENLTALPRASGVFLAELRAVRDAEMYS